MDDMEVAHPADVESGQTRHKFDELNQWQRISPIASLHFLSRVVTFFVGNGLVLIVPLALNYKRLLENLDIVVPVALTGFISLIIVAVLSYRFFQFRVGNGSVEVRSGILFKAHLHLPFERIQNISIEQPFYYRPYGYVSLKLDSAGSAKQEARIYALPLALGVALKEYILSHRDPAKNSLKARQTDAVPSSPTQETELVTRSLTDLVIHGLTNNRVWIVLGAMAPFLNSASDKLIAYFQERGIDLEQIFSPQAMLWWQWSVFAFSVFFLLLLASVVLSIIGSILMYYGFTLHKTQEGYVRRSGLITRSEISLKHSRIQCVVCKEDWLDKLLGRLNLVFEQNNISVSKNAHTPYVRHLTIPSVSHAQGEKLIADVFPKQRLTHIKFNTISRSFMQFYLAYFWMPVSILGVAISAYLTLWLELGIALILSFIWGVLIVLRWRRWCFAYDEHFLYAKNGLIGQNSYCIPWEKVQQVKYSTTPFMRRHELAKITYVVASRSIVIPFISDAEAQYLRDVGLFYLESRKQSWM